MYGLPPAGVLGLELLQHFRGRSRLDQDFPTSEIVQNLSVLISSIDCIIRPTSGNYEICNQAKKILQAILAAVLSPDRPDMHVEHLDQGLVDATQSADMDLDNQLWFDNDLDMDFWMNLEDHPLLTWPEITGGT